MKVNILGTDYVVEFVDNSDKDPKMSGAGYAELYSKKIRVLNPEIETDTVENVESYKKTVLRHEIVHAFLHESGISGNAEWGSYNEELVDWIALQFPKMLKVFKDVNALDE